MPKVKGNYCNVEGCHNRSEEDVGIERHYYRLPAIIRNQGTECELLSSERRRLWLARLNQDFTGKNLANVRVCSDHFVNGKFCEYFLFCLLSKICTKIAVKCIDIQKHPIYGYAIIFHFRART